MSGETRTPEEIQTEIHETREELGATAAALADKAAETADVKGRAKARIAEATPDSAGQAFATARQRPLPFAIAGAFAGGFAIGALLARRRS